jgi:hypothetical protein
MLHEVLEGSTAGDPMSSVKWTPQIDARAVSQVLNVGHTKAWRMLRVENAAFDSIGHG